MSRSRSSRGDLRRVLASQSVGPAKRWLRPLVLGPAILTRPAASRGPWAADLADDARLAPHAPASRADVRRIIAMHEACGRSCRLALALATPADAAAHATTRTLASDHDAGFTALPEICGWALLYQLPGMCGTGLVDPHDEHPDLPAFYECPLEFLDRSAYLASKGIRHRPLALVTCLQDFEPGNGMRPRRNRYFPTSRFRRPVDIARLA